MAKKEELLVSIIIPVYNAEDYLVECVSSVQNQSYAHWELLIVDNRSSGSSSELALRLGEKGSLKSLPIA